MPSIEWLTPAPLWAPKAEDLRIPRLVKLESDNFLPDFLEAMALAAPGQTPKDFLTDSSHDFQAPEDRIDGKLKLFHPAHGRFYLVTGSLVCRQLGLPDRPVALQDGERTSFVVRRRVAVGGKLQEQAWVDQGLKRGWQPLVDERGRAVTARSDEERHSLHPVQTSMVATTNGSVTMNGNGKLTIPAARTLYYGYIPVGNREKYLDRRPLAASTPEEILHQYEQDVRSTSAVDGSYDFRLDELKTRVLDPWRGIYTAATDVDQLKGQSQEKLPEFSLYLILDLADWLQRYLPSIFAAAAENQALPAGSKRQALLDTLQDITINLPPFGGNPNNISLAAAIKRLKNKIELVRGIGTEPNDTYNVRDATRPDGSNMRAGNGAYLETSPGTGEFLDAIQAALNESPAPATPPQEVLELLSDQVVIDRSTSTTAPDANTYFVRFLYERTDCPPAVSKPSKTFFLAKFFDPDAPARHIRIELPSINMKDLRKYKRGVGMEMSPDLRDVMSRISKDMLDGEGLSGSSGGWELGMICSFSLQIIFLVAFIVMFIFLIAFNFIFWWMAFLKICLPIPVKK